ncbi:MAG TPA: dihydrolipoamide acetyltransferase family protein [Myxococcota bacterium]|nr:dihydrolipoamide acetyltransferase family protein [Myxococcota bacterium]
MATVVRLPELGESVVEGTVSRWLVKEGDRVERDQPLVEVTTDKVDAEIPSPIAGVVEALLAAEGEVVAVGAALARIADAALAGASQSPGAKVAETTASASTPAPTARPESAPRSDAPPATPVARRVASQAQVDLRRIEPTGAGGKVTKRDVEAHLRGAREVAAPLQAERSAGASRAAGDVDRRPAYLSYSLQDGDRVIPMTPLRRLVAEHMVVSKRVSPHVGTVAEIDMAGVVRVREANKREFEAAHGFALSFLPFVVHATVRALREYPRLNASVLEDAIVEKRDIHMGIAVETDKGLVVPVVRHADRLSLAGLAEAVEDLAARARTKKLSPDELKGGSFTVSNPGRHGNLYGFAIINQPQVGILRMGELVKRPVVRSVGGEDAIVIRPIMHLALSYDHRAVDGAPANGFLHRVRQLLEEAEFDL